MCLKYIKDKVKKIFAFFLTLLITAMLVTPTVAYAEVTIGDYSLKDVLLVISDSSELSYIIINVISIVGVLGIVANYIYNKNKKKGY